MAESLASPSLLSLSLVAAQSLPLPTESDTTETAVAFGSNGASNALDPQSSRPKTRRLSSASSTRRRIQDAREATIRNSHAQNMAGLNHATSILSLGSPPPPSIAIDLANPAGPLPDNSTAHHSHTTQTATITAQSLPASSPLTYHMTLKSSTHNHTPKVTTLPNGHMSYNGTVSVGALEEMPPPYASVMGSKKKGTIFRCESCSKVYRHPSCLIKHRWEHSPHWKEANKFLLSKHQQVQLLEAAAILSHITPAAVRGEGGPATSLPEDRSLWPSYLASSVPIKADGRTEEDDREDYDEIDDEEIDIIEAGEDFEMEMEFDNTRFRDTVYPRGPISSSVPAGASFPKSLTNPSSSNGNGSISGHHRNRSRSRSISKSIHTHVIKSVRGHARRSSGRISEREGISILNGHGPTSGGESNIPVNGDGLSRITTLRPGLIGVPTGNFTQHPLPKEADSLAPSIGNSLSTRNGSSWSTNQHVKQSYPINGSAPININAPRSQGYPTNSYSNSFAAASVSLPRSSVRSSSGFTETDGDGPELYDELASGGSGSEGKRPSPAPKDRGEVQPWDGMEMEMEM